MLYCLLFYSAITEDVCLIICNYVNLFVATLCAVCVCLFFSLIIVLW